MIKRMRRPTHPGELLREEMLPNTGTTQVELAARLGVSRRTVSEIVHERRPITPDMAIRLARAFPNQTADFWLSMQAAVDIWDAEQSRSADYKRIRPLASRRSGLMV